ncbi:MAG: hypothetical protein MJ252_03075 [archaeon]|nr:hypothetical protein [archaeon]
MDGAKLKTLSERVRQGEDNRYTKMHGGSKKKIQSNTIVHNYYKSRPFLNRSINYKGKNINDPKKEDKMTITSEKKSARNQSMKMSNEKPLSNEEAKLGSDLKMSYDFKPRDSNSSVGNKNQRNQKKNSDLNSKSLQEGTQTTSKANSQLNSQSSITNKDFGNPKENALSLLIQSK